MAVCAGDGATRYDFLAGDNQLKRSLGREHYALYSHRFAKPTLGLRIEAGFRSARNRFGL
jgi:CelD/BcsL family acetyltransferase involved in cellulose biosynthesis